MRNIKRIALLLSLVLAALPFTQNLSENTLRIGVPFPFFTVRITALGRFQR